MKKNLLASLSIFLLSYSALCGEESDNQMVINLQDFSRYLVEGVELGKLKNIILACPAGSEIPLRLTIRGDVFSFVAGETLPLSIKVLNTCYLKHQGKGLLFSRDMQTWKDFSEVFTGKAAAALTFQDNVATGNMEIEINHQTNRWEVAFGSAAPLCRPCRTTYLHSTIHYPPSFHWEMKEKPEENLSDETRVTRKDRPLYP